MSDGGPGSPVSGLMAAAYRPAPSSTVQSPLRSRTTCSSGLNSSNASARTPSTRRSAGISSEAPDSGFVLKLGVPGLRWLGRSRCASRPCGSPAESAIRSCNGDMTALSRSPSPDSADGSKAPRRASRRYLPLTAGSGRAPQDPVLAVRELPPTGTSALPAWPVRSLAPCHDRLSDRWSAPLPSPLLHHGVPNPVGHPFNGITHPHASAVELRPGGGPPPSTPAGRNPGSTARRTSSHLRSGRPRRWRRRFGPGGGDDARVRAPPPRGSWAQSRPGRLPTSRPASSDVPSNTTWPRSRTTQRS